MLVPFSLLVLNCHLAQFIPVHTSGRWPWMWKFSYLRYVLHHLSKPDSFVPKATVLLTVLHEGFVCKGDRRKVGLLRGAGREVNPESLTPRSAWILTLASPWLAFFPHSHFPAVCTEVQGELDSSHSPRWQEQRKILSYWNGWVCNRSVFSSLPASWKIPAFFPLLSFDFLSCLTWGGQIFVLLLMSLPCPEFYCAVVLLINNNSDHSYHLLKVYHVQCFIYILI